MVYVCQLLHVLRALERTFHFPERGVRHRVVKSLAQRHTAGKWQSQDLNPDCLAPKPMFLGPPNLLDAKTLAKGWREPWRFENSRLILTATRCAPSFGTTSQLPTSHSAPCLSPRRKATTKARRALRQGCSQGPRGPGSLGRPLPHTPLHCPSLKRKCPKVWGKGQQAGSHSSGDSCLQVC